MWLMAGALVAGVTGMAMLFWALERSSLVALQAAADGVDHSPPAHIYLTMFVGLSLMNLATFYALTNWSRYLRAHPDTQQLPMWFLMALIFVAGAAMVFGLATHAGWVRLQDPIPVDPSLGYVLYMTVMGALVVVPLVLLGVRWSPGYKHRAQES
jgi:hypothetical protein